MLSFSLGVILAGCADPDSSISDDGGAGSPSGGGSQPSSLAANPDTFEVIEGRSVLIPMANLCANDSYSDDSIDLTVI